jgi:predicted nucleic acid-binding protein
MLVVADTSSLIALAACDGLSLLDALFGQIKVPSAVYEESTVEGRPYSSELRTYLGTKVVAVDMAQVVIAAPGLGAGELEAMALYKQLHADRLLIDDARARRIAQLNHILVIGSIGVLIVAKQRGMLPLLRPSLELIQHAGIHISESLLQEALKVAEEA